MSGDQGREDKERRVGDERLHDEVMTCYAASCGMCRRNCPIYDITGRMVHSSTGKNRVIRGYLEGNIEPSQELAEAIFTCTLCGNCDVMCAVPNTEHFIAMSGREVFKAAILSMEKAVDVLLTGQGLGHSDIRWLLPHQANMRIIKVLGDYLDLPPEKVFKNVQRYGNTSAASTAIGLHELRQMAQFEQGDKIVIVAFGAGLTSGACLLEC